jgi:hypothetical protein
MKNDEQRLGRYDLHFDFDSEHTLPEQNVTDGVVDEVASGLTRVDHESIGELHRFRTGSTELARYNHFTSFGIGFHNETEDTIAGTIKPFNDRTSSARTECVPADSKTTKELVS